jgi:predicted site-specific integrase-resolvase
MPRLLTSIEAAQELNIKPQTLAAWRVKGIGPAFIKMGHCVRYDAEDLRRYKANQRRQSTSVAAATGFTQRELADAS